MLNDPGGCMMNIVGPWSRIVWMIEDLVDMVDGEQVILAAPRQVGFTGKLRMRYRIWLTSRLNRKRITYEYEYKYKEITLQITRVQYIQ